jgi:superoxide dismutase
MARVLNLLDVFELIVDAFDDRALAQSQLIHQWHEFVMHVLADLGDQVQAALPEFVEKALGDVAPIRDELAGQALSQVGDGLTVVNVAGRDPKREQLATIIDDQVELESEKPAHGVFTASAICLNTLWLWMRRL